MPNRLCTAAQANARMTQGATVDQAVIEEIIDGITNQIIDHVGRTLFRETNRVDYARPNGRIIQLPLYPIETVSEVIYDPDRAFGAGCATYAANTDYILEPTYGVLAHRYCNWPHYRRSIRVTYDGGYVAPAGSVGAGQTAMPQPLIEACIRQTIGVYQSRKQAGLSQVVSVDGNIQKYSMTPLYADVEGLIQPYVSALKVLF